MLKLFREGRGWLLCTAIFTFGLCLCAYQVTHPPVMPAPVYFQIPLMEKAQAVSFNSPVDPHFESWVTMEKFEDYVAASKHKPLVYSVVEFGEGSGSNKSKNNHLVHYYYLKQDDGFWYRASTTIKDVEWGIRRLNTRWKKVSDYSWVAVPEYDKTADLCLGLINLILGLLSGCFLTTKISTRFNTWWYKKV
jgi:hypothetical protein